MGVKCDLAKFGSLDRGFRYSGFVISGFLPIQTTVILPDPKTEILRYIGVPL